MPSSLVLCLLLTQSNDGIELLYRLSACCAKSGTDLAFGSYGLCARYAMSGTHVAYGGI